MIWTATSGRQLSVFNYSHFREGVSNGVDVPWRQAVFAIRLRTRPASVHMLRLIQCSTFK